MHWMFARPVGYRALDRTRTAYFDRSKAS
jgi:hypothetical protein